MREWATNPAYDEGLACFQSGDYQSALDRLARALALQPDRPRIHSNHAFVLLALDRIDEARQVAEHARDLADPDDPYPLWVLAQIHDRTGNCATAVELADAALARPGCTDADRVNILITKAWALVHLDSARLAVAAARDAVRLGAARADAHSILARSLALANRWGEALRSIDRALALAPDNTDAAELEPTLRKGLAIAQNGVDQAREECDQPGASWESWHALGTCLTMTGALADAAIAFDRAHALKGDNWPDEPEMLSTWEVDCRLAMLDDPEATAAYAAARELEPPRRVTKKEAPAKKPATKPAKNAANKPATKAANKPASKAANKPAKKAATKAATKAANKPATKAATKAANKPATKAANKPATKAANKPAKKAANKPAKKAANKPAKKPAKKPANKPAKKAVNKPAKKAVNKPAKKAANKPAKKPVKKRR